MAACPIFSGKNKKVVGVVSCLINVSYLTEMVNKVKIGQTGYSLLLNNDGLVLAHPKKENILKTNFKSLKGEGMNKSGG
jgi:methyl-accepting chemotaxis protein